MEGNGQGNSPQKTVLGTVPFKESAWLQFSFSPGGRFYYDDPVSFPLVAAGCCVLDFSVSCRYWSHSSWKRLHLSQRPWTWPRWGHGKGLLSSLHLGKQGIYFTLAPVFLKVCMWDQRYVWMSVVVTKGVDCNGVTFWFSPSICHLLFPSLTNKF